MQKCQDEVAGVVSGIVPMVLLLTTPFFVSTVKYDANSVEVQTAK
jgi:hypothetical protein